jgi:hypothetical protein
MPEYLLPFRRDSHAVREGFSRSALQFKPWLQRTSPTASCSFSLRLDKAAIPEDGRALCSVGWVGETEPEELIHHYTRSAVELWKFCGSSGGAWVRAARTLAFLREKSDAPDWWEAGAPRGRRGRQG